MSDKPIPESYWVIPGRFLAGAYPIPRVDEEAAHQSLAVFIQEGFNAFLDLTRAGELPAYQTILQEEATRQGIAVTYQRMLIKDKSLPSMEEMKGILDALDAALTSGRKVYLHCWGGIGRTGMTVGCWLVRHGLTGEQALIRLNELYQTSEQSRLHSSSPETDAQIKFILDWVEHGMA